MKRYLGIALMLGLLAGLPCFSPAQELVLEAPAALKTCDNVHAIDGESKCTTFHVVVKNPDLPEENSSMVGSLIELNGSPYVIEWTGTGYYTASGRILHAVESSGQVTELVEVRPLSGIVHPARWQDVDLDGRLSASDTVIVNGVSEQIVDTRLNLRVVPKR